MGNFVKWLDKGEFTPFGYAYDIGNGAMWAIRKYKLDKQPTKCGGTEEWNNGNGSLMRILPACLFAYAKKMNDDEAIQTVHQVSSLTHAHIRANIACGLYYFMVKAILDGEGGYCAHGELFSAEQSLKMDCVPLGLSETMKIVRPVKKGQLITWNDVSFDAQNEGVALRRQMEALFKKEKGIL